MKEAYVGRVEIWEIVKVRETIFESGTRLKEDKWLLPAWTLDYVKDSDPGTHYEKVALQTNDDSDTYTGMENLLIHRGSIGARFSAVLNANMSPFGNDWTYASSAERRYIACIVLSRLFGPYVENERFWTGGLGWDGLVG